MPGANSSRVPSLAQVAIWVIDILLGFAAFAVTILAVILTEEHQDPRVVVLAATVAYFIVGLLRRPRGRWISSTLRVAAAGLLPMLAMQAHDSHSQDRLLFWCVLAAAAGALFAGRIVRVLTVRGRLGFALAVGVIVCLADSYLAMVVSPAWLAQGVYRAVDLPVRPFNVQTFAGQRVNSQQWTGRVVVLAFWATWCGPCKAELPEVAIVRDRYRDNPGVLFLAIDPGWRDDTEQKANAYLSNHRVELNGAEDVPIPGAEGAGEASRSLAVQGLPILFIIDRAGNVRFIHEGYLATEHLSETLPHRIDALL